MILCSTNMEACDLDLDRVNRELDHATPPKIIQWAVDTFGDQLVLSSSFGAQAAVMLHMVTRVAPGIPIVFVDTGYLFPETYQFAQALSQRLNLNLKIYQPRLSAAHHEAIHGRQWEQGPESLAQYNQVRKIEPMRRALGELAARAWLAGLRADQTEHRSGLRTVELQEGYYKIHPILKWAAKDVHAYLKTHDLPYHPLYEQGFRSIGDTHSTLPVTAGMHERAGRFHGLKQECGLHLPTSAEENQSRESSGL